jgi:hypothetical protein
MGNWWLGRVGGMKGCVLREVGNVEVCVWR